MREESLLQHRVNTPLKNRGSVFSRAYLRLMPRLDWEADVRPVLVAVKNVLDATDDLIRGGDLESVHAALGDTAESEQVTHAVLEELRRTDYIEGKVGFGNPPVMFFIKLTEKDRQEVAGWPVAPGAGG